MRCLLWHRPGDRFRAPAKTASKQTRVAQTAFSLQKAWKIQQSSLMVIAWIGLFKYVNAIGQHHRSLKPGYRPMYASSSWRANLFGTVLEVSVREIYVAILNLELTQFWMAQRTFIEFLGLDPKWEFTTALSGRGNQVFIVTKYEYKWCYL